VADLADAAAVIRVLRRGPVTVSEVVAETGLSQDKVYRLVESLEQAGAPITRGEFAREEGGRPAATLRITAAGLRKWLG
jgi:sugar-specific transcriptional regulator TrmB